MFSRASAKPSPAPDEQPVPFERGSGRHRADTMPMPVVSPDRAPADASGPSADDSDDAAEAGRA